jgi:dipeptidyl aminopeptidase/acylaminoacyl peptidase
MISLPGHRYVVERWVLLVAVAVNPCCATGQVAYSQRTLKLADVFHLQHATEVQISPDERTIVYARVSADILTDTDQPKLWLVDVKTGRQSVLTSAVASSPRWSADSKHIAYIADDRAGRPQIFVRNVNGLVRSVVSTLAEPPSEISWSPDGRLIAFLMFVPGKPESLGTLLQRPAGATWADPPKVTTSIAYHADGSGDLPPGHTHIFLISSLGGAARQLTSGNYDDLGTPAWTPDGQHLLFSSDRREKQAKFPTDSEIFDVSVSDGYLTQLTKRKGPDQQALVSPDGRLIAYTGFDDHGANYDETRLYLMDRDGSHPRVLSGKLDRDIFQIAWSADGNGVYVLFEDLGVTTVGLLDLTGKMTMIAAGLAGEFSVGSKGAIAYPLGAADHPPDVGISSASGDVRRLTNLNANFLRDKDLGELRPLAVKSSFDGSAIGAWMLLPPGYQNGRQYPTILSIHGGPYGDFNPVWSTSFQLYAAAGYVTIFANARGSIGYGDAFSQQIRHDFPGHDYDDQISVVDAAVALGVADPNRLFVTGGSAGGEMTTWIVGKTSRFRAAVAEKPVINEISQSLATDQYTSAKDLFGKLPWEDFNVFWKHSPLSIVGNVRTPTLIMVGEEDRRTPLTESEQYYDALQLCGIPTALVRVPGASHESLASRPSQLAAEISITLAWFARYDAASRDVAGHATRSQSSKASLQVLNSQAKREPFDRK